MDTGGVSLSFVFGVASIVLFGWAAGLLVVFLAPAITQLLEHRPPIRIAYNVSVLALAATAAGAFSAPFSDAGGPSGVPVTGATGAALGDCGGGGGADTVFGGAPQPASAATTTRAVNLEADAGQNQRGKTRLRQREQSAARP